jgi:UDP-glucose 6-dehydrogenase
MLDAAVAVNYQRVPYYLAQLRARLGGSLAEKRVAVLGLAFKPNTDDVRGAPALRLLHALLAEGAHVSAYDPQVGQRLAAEFPGVIFAPTLSAALQETAAAIIATDWPEIKAWQQGEHRYPGVILDGRP